MTTTTTNQETLKTLRNYVNTKHALTGKVSSNELKRLSALIRSTKERIEHVPFDTSTPKHLRAIEAVGTTVVLVIADSVSVIDHDAGDALIEYVTSTAINITITRGGSQKKATLSLSCLKRDDQNRLYVEIHPMVLALF